MNMVVGLEKFVCSFIDSIFAKKNSRTSGLLNFNLFNPEMLDSVLLSQKYIGIGMRLHVVFGSSVGRPLDLAMTKTV